MPPESLLPVAHRPDAFADAVAAIDTAIERLNGAMDDRHGRVRDRLSQWEGTSRNRFGAYGQSLAITHQDVLGELRATRRNLETTLEAIQAENRRRATALAAWHEEQRQAAAGGP